jgi:hypothetical protein
MNFLIYFNKKALLLFILFFLNSFELLATDEEKKETFNETAIIFSNRRVLIEKYGEDGIKKIHDALDQLVEADKQKKIVSTIIYLDHECSMRKYGHIPVRNEGNKQEYIRRFKEAIDVVYNTYKSMGFDPYIVLLGSIDVIPHQHLQNPDCGAENIQCVPEDDNGWFESDLPYACDANWSEEVKVFLNPTRKVGRLPDIIGGRSKEENLQYLIKLLVTATQSKTRDLDHYLKPFALSAVEWVESTRVILKSFQPHFDVEHTEVYSSNGPQWSHEHLQRRLHFINCNGSKRPGKSTTFFCDSEEKIPVITAKGINGNILEGTIVGVTCCYGARLYRHDQDIEEHMSICNTYLGNSAYGYFGSSTTACVSDLTKSDLIVRLFLFQVLRGKSLGEAVLQARREFIEQEQKTGEDAIPTSSQRILAQFNLMGYPSIQAIKYFHSLKSKL